MPTPQFPLGKVEIAPHVHNARYVCPTNARQSAAFQFIAGYEECDGRYRIARHSYPYLILEMVVGGEGSLRIDGATHAVEAGFCFCGGPDIPYEFSSSSRNPLRKYFLVFGSLQSGNLAPQRRLYPGFTTPHAPADELRKWGELILAEGASQSPDALENVSALASVLVRKIAPDASGRGAEHSTDALVVRALREIERNFKSLTSLESLATSLSVSSEHLCRVFKANRKASPYRILMRRKMEHAYAQLKMTQTPIQEIAHSLGFSDSFHFSRAFKKRYGIPPSRTR
ncbi:AraC family transcriptional regulator [Pelagicoccus sp. NFK12]|uniref:AraC family transcriptional regulator n=1 Tax=Pelagicoccus enzymogenes TaxID=2773457 RepID=A0A927F7B9_9BACT|nr:AraC family transcriptional regulator [Pelagicoccus enzymogenes]MBD5778551.1 AraC family transcriptional regulator [Pelagicoccus enzymogenes]MDQ8197088.1 AraC family transcriptional regulator [Pelagicoccus enzymogenes]